MLIKKFSLNHLTIRTFTVFWLAFFAMTALLVALPYFDSRLYSDLIKMKYQAIKRNSLNLFVTIELTGFLLACQFFQPINLTLHALSL